MLSSSGGGEQRGDLQPTSLDALKRALGVDEEELFTQFHTSLRDLMVRLHTHPFCFVFARVQLPASVLHDLGYQRKSQTLQLAIFLPGVTQFAGATS